MDRDPEEFWRRVAAHFLAEGAMEMDADTFIAWGLDCGLVTEVLYDPKLHGEEIEGDPLPGEPIYVTVPRGQQSG